MSQSDELETLRDPYKLLEEIDAWLSFNVEPSKQELMSMRKTIQRCIMLKKHDDSLRELLAKMPHKRFTPEL